MIEKTGSTNADLIADRFASEGDWLVALEQHSGRGRQGREWISPPGNFYGSTLVELGLADPAPQTLSLVAGLALIDAIDLAVPEQALMLKWPNDVLLFGRKLAGILLERTGKRVIIGFGVNLASAPKLAERDCASLSGRITPQAFAPLLAGCFARLLQLWRQSEPALVRQAWLVRAHPIGTPLRVHSSTHEMVSGRFDGIQEDGALRLRKDDGRLEIVRAGDVEL
jgi:BirA family transcriptional regulator, biotin operon repressor / biotin---[acetyl-CoA-carboxylase] ligase